MNLFAQMIQSHFCPLPYVIYPPSMMTLLYINTDILYNNGTDTQGTHCNVTSARDDDIYLRWST